MAWSLAVRKVFGLCGESGLAPCDEHTGSVLGQWKLPCVCVPSTAGLPICHPGLAPVGRGPAGGFMRSNLGLCGETSGGKGFMGKAKGWGAPAVRAPGLWALHPCRRASPHCDFWPCSTWLEAARAATFSRSGTDYLLN